MFVIEVSNDGVEWEMIAEFFDCVEDAEAYYRYQVPEFPMHRVTEMEEC